MIFGAGNHSRGFQFAALDTSDRNFPKLGRLSPYLAACFCIGFSIIAFGQPPLNRDLQVIQKLTPSEVVLVNGSKAAIVSTGISSAYFDRHFKLERVIDTVSDRRVAWTYSIGDHNATLSDAVGFYTDEKGLRHDVHSVRDTLGISHEIKTTISRKRAEQLMVKCLGTYTPGAIVYQAFGIALQAALLFTASSIPKQPENSVDKGKPLIYTGFLNLETGKCTKGIAQAGRPRLTDR